MGYIYVGTPYTHPFKDVRDYRLDMVNQYALYLAKQGKVVHFPMSQWGSIAETHGFEEHAFYYNQIVPFLENATEFHILCLDGWSQSKGLCWERDLAISRQIKSVMVTPVTHNHRITWRQQTEYNPKGV